MCLAYVEVMRRYVIYHTVNGDYTLRGSMKETKNIFSRKFVLCSKSFLVNLEYVEEINSNQITLRGKGNLAPAERRTNTATAPIYIG